MKSVFDESTRAEIIGRINSVNEQSTAQWGKMDVSQMLQHCALCDDMYFGTLKIKRVLPGYLFGKMFLKQVLKNDDAFGRNSPTSDKLKVDSNLANVEPLKQAWINKVEQYATYHNPNFVHPFFGPMTREQVGYMAYKHASHHLSQFGA